MPNAENLKSARKRFQVLKVKTSLLDLQGADDETSDAKMSDILTSLEDTYGEADAAQILDDAIGAVDKQMDSAIGAAIASAGAAAGAASGK